MRCACYRRKYALYTNFSRLFRHYALEKSFKTCIIAFCARCARLGPGTDFDFLKGIYIYETVHQDRCCLRPGCQPGRLRQLRFFYRCFFCCLFRGCFQRSRSTVNRKMVQGQAGAKPLPALFVRPIAPGTRTCYTGRKNDSCRVKARKRP